MKNLRRIGVIEVLLSGLLFGLLGPLGKMAFAYGLAPFELLSLRFLAGGLILFSIYSIKMKKMVWPKRVQWVHLGLLGISGYALFSSLYFFAIRELSASLAVLLLYTYPVVVAFLSVIFKLERLSVVKVLCLASATLGMVLLIGADFSFVAIKGFLFGFGSAFFYSLYILASGKWLKGINPYWATSWIQIMAGLILLILAFDNLARPLWVLVNTWHLLAMITIFCTLGAMSLFQAGLQKLTPTETSLLSLSEPLSGIVLSLLFMGERLQFTQFLGGGLILTALVFLSLFERQSGNLTH